MYIIRLTIKGAYNSRLLKQQTKMSKALLVQPSSSYLVQETYIRNIYNTQNIHNCVESWAKTFPSLINK